MTRRWLKSYSVLRCVAHKGHPFCAETCMFWVEIELLRRNVTLSRGKTHMFRGKTNMFFGIATLLRLNTCLLCLAQVPRLKTKPFYMKLVNCFIEAHECFSVEIRLFCVEICACCVETRLFCVEIDAFCVEIKNTPRIAPLKFLMLLVPWEEEITLGYCYHKLLLLSNPAIFNYQTNHAFKVCLWHEKMVCICFTTWKI